MKGKRLPESPSEDTPQKPADEQLGIIRKRVPMDWTRQWLAFAFIGLMAIEIIGLLVLASVRTSPLPQDMASIQTAVVSGLFGVVGTVMGFYFGSKDGRGV